MAPLSQIVQIFSDARTAVDPTTGMNRTDESINANGTVFTVWRKWNKGHTEQVFIPTTLSDVLSHNEVTKLTCLGMGPIAGVSKVSDVHWAAPTARISHWRYCELGVSSVCVSFPVALSVFLNWRISWSKQGWIVLWERKRAMSGMVSTKGLGTNPSQFWCLPR